MVPRTLYFAVFCALTICSHAQYPMYEPGSPVDPSAFPTPISFYGITTGFITPCFADGVPDPRIACVTLRTGLSSHCLNTPADVSRTPLVSDASFPAIGVEVVVTISCGAKLEGLPYPEEYAPEGTKIVYTLNGTYPDIYGPSFDNPVVFYAMGGEEMFLVARCIEPGKLPSRITYVERREQYAYDCAPGGDWVYQKDYKPLNLPQCHPEIVGADKCDGQTIVEHPILPAHSTAPSPLPTPILPSTPLRTHRIAAHAIALEFPIWTIVYVVILFSILA